MVRRGEEAMAARRRIFIATLMGLMCGVLCALAGKHVLGVEMSLADALMIVAHRTLLGFVLGISSLGWHWAAHGALVGVIVGLPEQHFANMLRGSAICGFYVLAGPVIGIVIEFSTSVVFKAKRVAPVDAVG
jgi:hypothetical protein